MTPKEMIEIIQAYEKGEEIEWCFKRDSDWEVLPAIDPFDSECEQFDFNNYDYRIKKKRWRAEEGESYYYLSSRLSVEQTDDDYIIDRERYDAGNYFQTEEEALRAADHMKKSLKEFHDTE